MTFRTSRPIGTLTAAPQKEPASEQHNPTIWLPFTLWRLSKSFLSLLWCFFNIYTVFPCLSQNLKLTFTWQVAKHSTLTQPLLLRRTTSKGYHKPQTGNQPFFSTVCVPAALQNDSKPRPEGQELSGTLKAEAHVPAPGPDDTLLTNTLTFSPSRLHF